MTAERTNWAGHHTFRAARYHEPASVAEIQTIVQKSQKVRAVGSGHSFHDLADTPGDLISLARLPPSMTVDAAAQTVTFSGGMTYGQLCQPLHAAGYALHNMASLPHITVAGAIATATHGSGDGNGNLATAVTALEFVAADGTLVTLTRAEHGDHFAGAVVHLGGLGVITKLTLAIQPAFVMQQEVYEGLPLSQLAEHFAAITAEAYSVSLFIDWQQEYVNQVWLKRRLSGEAALTVAPTWLAATHAPCNRHPLLALPAEPCTPQLGLPGPWHERLPHFRVDHTPASGNELQTEYFVPRHHAVAAMRAMLTLRKQLAPVLLISEVRTIAADTLWMSPCYEQACIGIHFSWQKDWPAVQAVLPLVEEQLAPFQPRPHWGKLFTMRPAHFHPHFARLADFRALLQHYDPQGKFRNAFLDTHIFAVPSDIDHRL
jgi:xylitol oxidase